MVSTCGVGYDNLPLAYLKERGIKISNTPGVLNDAVCELAMGIMLGLLRRLPDAQELVKSTAWSKGPFKITTTLSGKRVGIAGMGRIGQELAARLLPFKVEICYSGPSPKNLPYTYIKDIQSLADACDVLFLTCPATPDTDKMVNAQVLEALGPKGYLINVARGSVIDEPALLYALQHKKIAGAAFDVFKNEPNINKELVSLPNFYITPHIGGSSKEAVFAMGMAAIDGLDNNLSIYDSSIINNLNSGNIIFI
jgi:lactate dehydrogenase-like 2-hydroxyacid dehydrogenase